MAETNQLPDGNDFAVAYTLNEMALKLVLFCVILFRDDSTKHLSITELNRVYVLIASELHKIYARNDELSSVKPEPIWRRYDVLIINTVKEVSNSLNDPNNNTGTTHNARVQRLWILSGEKKPEFSAEQQKLIEDYNKVLDNLSHKVDEIDEGKSVEEYGWQIPGYNLKYKLDGTILINQVMKLKKVHAGSITEKLIEQSLKNPNAKFKPNLGKTSRNLSTIISGAGFTPVLRDLFFPAVGDDFVVFRPSVSREQADIENIDTEQLDLHLKEIGAWCIVVREP